MTSRSRTRTFWALTVLLPVVVGALAIGGYFLWAGSQLLRLPERVVGDWLMERDDEIGFVPPRNGATEIQRFDTGRRVHFFTDARRARVGAPGDQTPAHVDVMAVGCSFTWGANVENEDTWPQQLGRMLGTPVANFGMGSYGSVQSFQMLVRNADLKPKVVVYGFIQDHLRRNLSPCAPNYVPYCLAVSYLHREGDWITLQPPRMELFSPEGNRAFDDEVVLRDPRGAVSWLLAATWAARIAWFRARHLELTNVDQSPETAALAMEAILRGMVTETQRMGAKLVVLNIPTSVAAACSRCQTRSRGRSRART